MHVFQLKIIHKLVIGLVVNVIISQLLVLQFVKQVN